MDESSRNIVKFIAAGTGAILLLMAAYYYSRAPEPGPVPPTAAEKAVAPVERAVEVAPPVEEPTGDTEYGTDEEIAPIDGQPTDPSTVDE